MWVTEKFYSKRNSVFERNIVFRYRHIIWINQFPSWAAQVNDAVARCTRILPLLDVVIVLVNVRTICFVLIELWARAQVCLEFLVCFFLFWRTYQNIRIFTNTMEVVYTPIQIIIIRKISDYIEVMIVLYFFSSSKLHSIGEFFFSFVSHFFFVLLPLNGNDSITVSFGYPNFLCRCYFNWLIKKKMFEKHVTSFVKW